MADYLDDCVKLEDVSIEALVLLARVIREEVTERMPAADALAIRDTVTSLLWRLATAVNGRVFSKTADGREILMSLGFVVRGSESAFEEAFIEHEGMLSAGRISLTEYVHPAIDRAFEP
jgi:hypothetical protein